MSERTSRSPAIEMLDSAWVGMKLICPACRSGKIFRNLTDMNPNCPHCGVTFEREEGDFIGAVVVAYSIVSVLVVVGVFMVEMIMPLSFTQHMIVWSIFVVLFMVFLYRNMKGIWLGILHAMVGLKAGDH